MRIKTESPLLAGILAATPEEATSDLVFVGLPDDSQSSFRRGAAAGPGAIRRAYDGDCYNSATETGLDLAGAAADLGDWPPKNDWPETYESYRDRAAELFERGRIPFFAGGDHAVTTPLIDALAVVNEPVHVIQFDAHPDLYPELDGNPASHACTGRSILEMDHVAALTQIGVRAMNPVQIETAGAFAARLFSYPARQVIDRIPGLDHIPADGLVYLTIDLDVFDPAFAPGVSHPVPGGLTPRQVLNFIQELPWRLIGLDVVELNPDRDVNGLTAILAGRLIHEAMGVAFGRSARAAGR